MSRIPISGIPTTYSDTQAGDTFAMDRGGTMGQITYSNLSASFIQTLGVGTITFSTVAAGSMRVTASSTARLTLQATTQPDTHEQTRLVRDGASFIQQTANSDGTAVASDYVATVGATGVSAHQWNIAGSATFSLQAQLATVTGTATAILDLRATDTTDTHERARFFKLTSGYGFSTVNAASDVAVTDYFATVGASGATQHSFFVGSTEELRVVAGSIRSRTHTPFSDGTESLGTLSLRWNTVWATVGTINTSDAREKEDINLLTDAEMRLAQRLKSLIRTYRWKPELNRDSKKHFGIIAQEVIEAFDAEGLDWTEYGVITGGGDEPFGVNYAELHSLILGA